LILHIQATVSDEKKKNMPMNTFTPSSKGGFFYDLLTQIEHYLFIYFYNCTKKQ